MQPNSTRQITLAQRPEGMPGHEHFRMEDHPLSEPQAGEVLVRTLYLSVDPYMRGRMNEGESYVPPFALNQAIAGGGIGEVVASKDPSLSPGDLVTGMLAWREWDVVPAKSLRKLDPAPRPLTTALGVLGMIGLTAYFGLLDIGKPQPGETVVVSGAAGAVGQVVGQIAKIHGCRVVGIAGGPTKTRYLMETLGFDAAIDYKATRDMAGAIAEVCPQGVDVYFDNVGGPISDAVHTRLNKFGRIAICGQIASYNATEPVVGPRLEPLLLVKSALAKGFIVGDYAARYPEAFPRLMRWYMEGKLHHSETLAEGFDRTVDAFLGLFKGENLGKQLVHVADPTGSGDR